ncbi:hypothetical protein [Marinobacter sp. ANT_B65]|uniref:hypothetical protein n=1 Tax=Marinobacter sp. ANT_B65 TaxID=2039467 RepID=UPI000BBEADEA|nr:hypothetical protein [Marinobacter sp. ANT_B65]PCM42734.1 hypothetical protein CPA50_18530 [Marinobacter sp. ANT_B65]
MMTRFLSHELNRQLATVLFLLMAALSGPLVASESRSEDQITETALPNENQPYQGTVNFVHQSSFELVIDDHLFALPPVVRFNNASWSREQVVQRIKQGDLVKMELGDLTTRDDAYTHTIRSITVIGQ